MYFRPETLDAFQDDENERGQAVGTLTNALNTNPKIAMWVMEHVLGYDLTEEPSGTSGGFRTKLHFRLVAFATRRPRALFFCLF